MLCVLAGGLLSPLGMSADAAARERTVREAMCDRVASHAGVALIKLGNAHAEDQWVTLAVSRALGVIGRGMVAAHRLLDFGVVQLLARALARYVDDSSAYEAAHMSALAMVAMAATSPANAEIVDRKGGRAALQRAAMANSALARALGMEYPNMAGWLAGRATARCGSVMRASCRRAVFVFLTAYPCALQQGWWRIVFRVWRRPRHAASAGRVAVVASSARCGCPAQAASALAGGQPHVPLGGHTSCFHGRVRGNAERNPEVCCG